MTELPFDNELGLCTHGRRHRRNPTISSSTEKTFAKKVASAEAGKLSLSLCLLHSHETRASVSTHNEHDDVVAVDVRALDGTGQQLDGLDRVGDAD